jgi:hypothetical protein
MEIILNGQKSQNVDVREHVFVTGLARSGTTGVMRNIFGTGQYASLQYSNMPFIMNPNIWQNKQHIQNHERVHSDGIIINGESPEEFDEYFWKAHLKDSFIKDHSLKLHQVSEQTAKQFKKYIQLICLSKNKQKYLSKNNNSILRLDVLRELNNPKIFFLFREPLSHASSLLKLHKKFSALQKEDPFVLEYFDFLGHHEFGLHHKPFDLTNHVKRAQSEFDLLDINYWLLVWLNYYEFILQNLNPGDRLICFEDLKNDPENIYAKLSEILSDSPSFNTTKPFTSTTEISNSVSESLLKQCIKLYNDLVKLKL